MPRLFHIEAQIPVCGDASQDHTPSRQVIWLQVVTLAWMLAKGSRVIPIPGSSRPETAVASAAAADVVLTAEQVTRLDAS